MLAPTLHVTYSGKWDVSTCVLRSFASAVEVLGHEDPRIGLRLSSQVYALGSALINFKQASQYRSTTRVAKDGTVLALYGEIDLESASRFERDINAHTSKYTPESCVLDASELAYIDSSGFAVLCRLAARMPVEIRNASNWLVLLFEIVSLPNTRVIPIGPVHHIP
ncbi:MAG: STAS domain-containing protein [Vicinamibacterales bacterium]